MKKLNIKRFIIILLIFIIIVLLIIPSIFNNLSGKTGLKDIGYNKHEINEINNLTDEEINTILKYEYNNNLINIIKEKNYDSNKLDLYIKYTLKYNDIDFLKIYELINSKEFKEENIEEYSKLLKQYDNINSIIVYVNNYNDIEISETTLNLITQKYFIKDYLDRYITYYNKNNNLEYSEIISIVNSNADKIFYTDSTKADISKGMYTLVNKFYYLDENFEPEEIVSMKGKYTRDTAKLNKTAQENFIKMADAASLEGLTLKITTAYRNYNFQATLYNNYVKADGVESADTYSARPGYSEHQLGYSVDLTNKDLVAFEDFENTKEFNWLSNNAHKYGFILRFPKDKEYLTGYQYESWHYRYVGIDIATYIYENNITYEEYYAYFLR